MLAQPNGQLQQLAGHNSMAVFSREVIKIFWKRHLRQAMKVERERYWVRIFMDSCYQMKILNWFPIPPTVDSM